VRVNGSFGPARGLTAGRAAPNGKKRRVDYENTDLVEAESGPFSLRRDQVDHRPGKRAECRRSVSPHEHGSRSNH
jgi:hypothetical protein